jgi:hypothetical protein
MPRESFKSLSAQEQKLIFHFLREGGVEERIEIVERKARIPRGQGLKIIRRRHVAEEIARRKAQVELEQSKLIARDQNRAAEDEDKRQSVTLDKIERKLDKLLELDPEKHGSLVLSAIQTGLVYTGTIRNGRMERTAPPIAPAGTEAAGEVTSFYDSVFDRMRAAQGEIAPAPVMPGASTPEPIAPPPAPIRPAQPPRPAAAPHTTKPPQKMGVTIT